MRAARLFGVQRVRAAGGRWQACKGLRDDRPPPISDGPKLGGEMIELRLQRVQAFGVDLDVLQDFAEKRLDAIQPLIDARVAGA